MSELYESKISTARWMVYDIAGNAGWILYFIMLYRHFFDMTGLMRILMVIPAVPGLRGFDGRRTAGHAGERVGLPAGTGARIRLAVYRGCPVCAVCRAVIPGIPTGTGQIIKRRQIR